MSQRFPNVWYADPEKLQSASKLVVFNDRGSLEVSPGQVQYRGKTVTLSFRKAIAVSLTGQRIPWVSYAVANAAVVAYYAVLGSGLLNPYVFAAVLVAANLLGLLIGTGTKWVAVEYQDETDQPRTAHFADGSALGWGGIFGGTTALYRAIRQVAEPAAAAGGGDTGS